MKRFNGFSQALLLVVCSGALAFGQAPATKNSNNANSKNPPASVKLTGQQLNTLVSQEATQNLVTYLTNQSGGGPLSGTWSGTVTDQGWSLTFSGSINSQAAALTESGFLKGKVASWTDSGTVGSNNVSGSGTATLMSNNRVKWAQKIGQDNMPEDIIDVIQQWYCDAGYPCDVVHFISDIIRHLVATTEFDLKTGSVFGSSVPLAVQGVTTIQQGAIALKTGAISYDSDTFTPQGSEDLR